jgi:excinuclease UvrABC nuclease subunit
MKEDLKATRWNRVAIRLNVPAAPGVFLLGAAENADSPENVLLVGSATNLRRRMLELLDHREIKTMSARVIHWVAGLTIEQAQLAERLFVRRYNPPLNLGTPTRYHDILIG